MQDFNFCWFFITRGHWSCSIAQFASYIFLAKFSKRTAVDLASFLLVGGWCMTQPPLCCWAEKRPPRNVKGPLSRNSQAYIFQSLFASDLGFCTKKRGEKRPDPTYWKICLLMLFTHRSAAFVGRGRCAGPLRASLASSVAAFKVSDCDYRLWCVLDWWYMSLILHELEPRQPLFILTRVWIRKS